MNCCVCTSTKDLRPYNKTKWRCKICEKEDRKPGGLTK